MLRRSFTAANAARPNPRIVQVDTLRVRDANNIEMIGTSKLCVISLSYIFYIFQRWNLLEKGFFCRLFTDQKDLYKNFLQIKVEDLKFILAQITFKYSKKRRKTVATPRVFARWAGVDHPPLAAHSKWCAVNTWNRMFPLVFLFSCKLISG